MTKVKTVTASRDYPEAGIKRLDKCYVWSLFIDGRWKTFRQKEKPEPEQLTTSGFMLQWMKLFRRMAEFEGPPFDDLGDIIIGFEKLEREAKRKYGNLPEGLKVARNGIILEKRVDACRLVIGKLEETKNALDDFYDRKPFMRRSDRKLERYRIYAKIREISEIKPRF